MCVCVYVCVCGGGGGKPKKKSLYRHFDFKKCAVKIFEISMSTKSDKELKMDIAPYNKHVGPTLCMTDSYRLKMRWHVHSLFGQIYLINIKPTVCNYIRTMRNMTSGQRDLSMIGQ